MEQARQKGAKLLVLPELCVTGYTCGDLFLQSALLGQAQAALEQIRVGSHGSDLIAVVGAPLIFENKLYNCAIFIQNGRYPCRHTQNLSTQLW